MSANNLGNGYIDGCRERSSLFVVSVCFFPHLFLHDDDDDVVVLVVQLGPTQIILPSFY